MDIQEAREAFERRRANALNVSYEGLKANFDENSRLFGTRYNAGSINEKEWNLWLEAWQAKAQAVPEGFVLVSAEQLSQWGHMANYAEQYGCPECFEARGYAHNLGCEINAYFNASEAQEPAND